MGEGLELLRRWLNAAGVPVVLLDVDHLHPQALTPVETRWQPPTGFGSNPNGYAAEFYPTVFRWQMGDGSRGSMLLNPILRQEGGRWRYDHLAQGQQLIDKLRKQYAPAQA